MTTEKYQAEVSRKAIKACEDVSRAADVARRAARDASYGAKDIMMIRMWVRLSCEAARLSAHAAVAADEEKRRLERLAKN
jgi:hypothetical protein